jgi:hypothetical protein
MTRELTPIPTEYAGVTFRSRIEAEVAQHLDWLRMPWEYEARSFLLPSGVHYRPDFWIPSRRTVVEVRGYSSRAGDAQLVAFDALVRDGHLTADLRYSATPLVDAVGFQAADVLFVVIGAPADLLDPIALAHCSHCNAYYFYPEVQSWHCRACGVHDGDGHFDHLGRLVIARGHLGWTMSNGVTIPTAAVYRIRTLRAGGASFEDAVRTAYAEFTR